MTRVGIFDVDDTPGLADVVAATVAAIGYPLERCLPALAKAGRTCVPIGTPMPPGVPNTITGQWDAGTNAIWLGTQFTGWLADVPFVLAHEIGHMVDSLVLTGSQRTRLMALMHDHPDFSVPPNLTHDAADMTHFEFWANGGAPYPAKVYECWADEFVAAFAPTVWDGTVLAGSSRRWPRFVHWSDDLAAVRAIALPEAATPEPTPPAPPAPVKPKPPRKRKPRSPKRRRRLRERLRRALHRRRARRRRRHRRH